MLLPTVLHKAASSLWGLSLENFIVDHFPSAYLCLLYSLSNSSWGSQNPGQEQNLLMNSYVFQSLQLIFSKLFLEKATIY